MRLSALILTLSGLTLIAAACSDDVQAPAPQEDAGQDALPASDLADEEVASIPRGYVRVTAGTFTMGSPASEPCRDEAREAAHEVTLTRDFEISATEVTQGELEDLLGYNPSTFDDCGADCPVDTVSWHIAAAYCSALSVQEGLTACYSCVGTDLRTSCSVVDAFDDGAIATCPGYRLPTEAEWEYAYRTGTDTALHNGPIATCEGSDGGADAIGWYAANSATQTHPVGAKAPNALGLFDMAGNVWEWCHDRYAEALGAGPVTDPWGAATGGFRVLRGGAWATEPGRLRAAERSFNTPASGDPSTGFRCVRSLL